MKAIRVLFMTGACLAASGGLAMAQSQAPVAKAQAPAAAAPATDAPTSLSIYFANGSYTVAPQQQATLDEASRIFNDGKPIVMIITGMTDATGAPGPNLLLSQQRADTVFQGLVARGLPPQHFQILAEGATASLAGKTPDGADPALRKVEITWR